jgi:hypothetical protein
LPIDFGLLNITLLGSFGAAAQEKNKGAAAFTAINTITRPVVDSQFKQVSCQPSVIAEIATTKTVDTSENC